MHILLTRANAYIGMRLLPTLLEAGHILTGIVRSITRFPSSQFQPFIESKQLTLLEGNLLGNLPSAPENIDTVCYLLHSMGGGSSFEELEAECPRLQACSPLRPGRPAIAGSSHSCCRDENTRRSLASV